MGLASRLAALLVGTPTALPQGLLRRFPELAAVRFRRGGLPPRIGGWALGRATVEAITLRRTVFLGAQARLDPALLLHEARHVQQFLRYRTFPLRYLWETARRGYLHNRYELDARRYATHRLAAVRPSTSARDG